MRWLLWSILGVAMEFDGGGTFSEWAATRDGPWFAALIGMLLGAAWHVFALRMGCWQWTRC